MRCWFLIKRHNDDPLDIERTTYRISATDHHDAVNNIPQALNSAGRTRFNFADCWPEGNQDAVKSFRLPSPTLA